MSEAGGAKLELERELRVEPDPYAAAFFDVDNTMMIGASIFHFAKGLAARGFFSWRDLARFTTRQVTLRLGGGNQQPIHSPPGSAPAFRGREKGPPIAPRRGAGLAE